MSTLVSLPGATPVAAPDYQSLERPLNFTESAAAKVKLFAQQLAQVVPTVKVLFWDERLTTREAQRALHDAGKNAKQSKKMIDQVAAQILLQNYMDSLEWTRLSNA